MRFNYGSLFINSFLLFFTLIFYFYFFYFVSSVFFNFFVFRSSQQINFHSLFYNSTNNSLISFIFEYCDGEEGLV